VTVRITRLPPGTALGAGDLHTWAKRRLAGRGGVPKTRAERKVAAARSEAQDATAQWLAAAERKARRPQAKLKVPK
jgi:hypothetical protein